MCLLKVDFQTDNPPKTVFWAYKVCMLLDRTPYFVFAAPTFKDFTVGDQIPSTDVTRLIKTDQWLTATQVTLRIDQGRHSKVGPNETKNYTSGFHVYTRLTDAVRANILHDTVVVRVKVRGRRTKGKQNEFWDLERNKWSFNCPVVVCDQMYIAQKDVDIAWEKRRQDRIWGKR